MPQTEVTHLLQKAFRADEWELLSENPAFMAILKQYEGTVVEHFEHLVEVGQLFLRQGKDAKRE